MEKYLIIIVLLCLNCSYAQVFNVLNFGASTSIDDNSEAFQICIDEASKYGGSCFVPAGEYKFMSSIYLRSNCEIYGEGDKSVLIFSQGAIRGYKNESREFYYTNNYNNEIVPNIQKTKVVSVSEKGSNYIAVENSKLFFDNDEVLLFNNILDSWTILENNEKKFLWNSDNVNLFAKGMGNSVLSVKDNIIELRRSNIFNMPENGIISKRAGVKNAVLSRIKIVVKRERFAVLLEQPLNVELSYLTLECNGGILLTHFAKECKIVHNSINGINFYAIGIENFSSNNIIQGNNVLFSKNAVGENGDAAIIVLMGSFENIVKDNIIRNKSINIEFDQNNGGIFVHALCFSNEVVGNEITNFAEGLGTYYGAYNNLFSKNIVINSRIGYMSYYSRVNKIEENSFMVSSEYSRQNRYGILDYGSDNNHYIANKVEGSMTFGLQFQLSKNDNTAYNVFRQKDKIYSKAYNIIKSSINVNNILESNNFEGFRN